MTELLRLENLGVGYPITGGIWGRKLGEVRAVQDVSFSIQQGETLGLVGESGCGKSTLGKALVRLLDTSSGKIFFKGTEIQKLPRSTFQSFRRQMQIIFQDPFSSLNPRMRVGSILMEPLIIHKLCPKDQLHEKTMELLKIVGLRPEAFEKFPHEFSGGQRQRIGIARALAVQPEFIVADEPISALDVSIQSQILNLMKTLQKEFKLTYLFISHDLNVIRYLCDRVVVMYLGRVVEILSRQQLSDPHSKKHPYTIALLNSAPKRHPDEVKDHKPLQGDIPSPSRPPSGCVFHPRCPEAVERCSRELPPLKLNHPVSDVVACHQR